MRQISLCLAGEYLRRVADLHDTLGACYSVIQPESAAFFIPSGKGGGALILSEAELAVLKARFESGLNQWLSEFEKVLIFPNADGVECAKLVSELSGAALSFKASDSTNATYQVADNRGVCGPFAGLSVTSSNPKRDLLAVVDPADSRFETIVSANGGSLFLKFTSGKTEFFLLSCPEIFDGAAERFQNLDAGECFSGLVPLLFFLLNCSGVPRWRTNKLFANVILDDPNLEARYGFVRFASLAQLLDELKCSLTVGFIPWNFRRNSKPIVNLFKSKPRRLSVCMHGCDHTAAEFAVRSEDQARQLTALAQGRMQKFSESTGLKWDRVMVFPQGIFSGAAMDGLRSSELLAAVNTELQDRVAMRGVPARELLRPVVTFYSGFPLFLRRKPEEPIANFALDLLLGKPCLVVTHHDFFKNKYAAFRQLISALNALQPGLQWTNLEEIVSQLYSIKQPDLESIELKIYSNETALEASPASARVRITVHDSGDPSVEVSLSGKPLTRGQNGNKLAFESPSIRNGDKLTVAPLRKCSAGSARQSAKYRFKVAMRRYLSEIRDNYVVPVKFALRTMRP